jgi:transcriptional regulator with XRE-family HTH domain
MPRWIGLSEIEREETMRPTPASLKRRQGQELRRARVAFLRERFATGVTFEELLAELGISHATLWAFCQRHRLMATMKRAAGDTLGARVSAARTRAKLTQSRLAQVAGLRQSTIIELEADRYEPTASTLRRLANALGCTMDSLIP